MKTRTVLLLIGVFAVMASCTSTPFYQVYRVTPSDESIVLGDRLVYEDNNCRVSYNLWREGGNAGFYFLNKTDSNIYLHLDECFFILNGMAYDYFKNRTYTNSAASASMGALKSMGGLTYFASNSSNSNSMQIPKEAKMANVSGRSVAYSEKSLVCIPPKASKVIEEYAITDKLYRNCDLYIYPTKRKVRSMYFSKAESPITFSNVISYSIDTSKNRMRFENRFYVMEIANYPFEEMTEYKTNEFCGEESGGEKLYFKNVSPNKFYVKYTKDKSIWRH